MRFKKKQNGTSSTFTRWLCLLIPPFNLYAMWALAKIWANVEDKHKDYNSICAECDAVFSTVEEGLKHTDKTGHKLNIGVKDG